MAMPSNARLLLVDKDAVAHLLEPDAVLDAVREAFILHSQSEGRVFPVVREALSTGGIFGIKSGDVPQQGLLGFKAAGFWPQNRVVGSEPHQATILLIDPENGRPICLIDGNAITTARTGAAGGVGLGLLARQNSTSACVFGAGVQAQIQLEFALRLMPTLTTVRYLTGIDAPSIAFERHFSGRCNLQFATDANVAVSQSDLIITATPGSGPLFDADAVRPGTHVNCVGADTKGKRELPPYLLQRARLFVDDKIQARSIGESQWAPRTHCDEIGDVLTAKVHLNRQPTDITVFDMTGLALQDLTVARLVHRSALQQGAGTSIAWPW
jgi:ornithine cyclodeaminase